MSSRLNCTQSPAVLCKASAEKGECTLVVPNAGTFAGRCSANSTQRSLTIVKALTYTITSRIFCRRRLFCDFFVKRPDQLRRGHLWPWHNWLSTRQIPNGCKHMSTACKIKPDQEVYKKKVIPNALFTSKNFIDISCLNSSISSKKWNTMSLGAAFKMTVKESGKVT